MTIKNPQLVRLRTLQKENTKFADQLLELSSAADELLKSIDELSEEEIYKDADMIKLRANMLHSRFTAMQKDMEHTADTIAGIVNEFTMDADMEQYRLSGQQTITSVRQNIMIVNSYLEWLEKIKETMTMLMKAKVQGQKAKEILAREQVKNMIERDRCAKEE